MEPIKITTINQEIELFKRIADNENRVTIQNIKRVKRMYEKVKPLITPDTDLTELQIAKSKIVEYLTLLCFEHERASNQTGTVPKFTGPVYEQYRDEVHKTIKGFEHLLTRVNTLIDTNKESVTNWNGLRLDLIENDFIQNAEEKLFNLVVEYHIYPAVKDKIMWKKSRRRAVVFASRLGMKRNEFNICFKLRGIRDSLCGDDYKGYGGNGTDNSKDYEFFNDSFSDLDKVLTKHGF